ncbi:hypothetical protein TNCV_2365991 [Trichonephila clavipes]|nr:hypothetical protein TNCV_2365991 [Trichonephila clavipes]
MFLGSERSDPGSIWEVSNHNSIEHVWDGLKTVISESRAPLPDPPGIKSPTSGKMGFVAINTYSHSHKPWRGHREERDLQLNDATREMEEKRRRERDQDGGAIGHGRMSGIDGDDLNKMVLTT